MDRKDPRISVIIPVFNEESTVGNVVRGVAVVLRNLSLNYEIIVVNDCSTDRSLEVLKNHDVRVFSLRKHMGKGYALRVGFAGTKGEIIVTIDSDGSHRPEEMPKLLAPLLQNTADLVIGSRHFNGRAAAARRLNAFGVQIIDSLIRLLTGVQTSDSQSGYRAMRSKVLRSMSLESGEYEIESEMLVKAARNGSLVAEVPISFEQRTYGTSHVDPMIDGLKILLSILVASLRTC